MTDSANFQIESSKTLQTTGNNIINSGPSIKKTQSFPACSKEIMNEIDKNIVELNSKLQLKTDRSMEINPFILLKDNIKNYRKLSEYEKMYLFKLSNEEKIEIINLYDHVLSTIVELHRPKRKMRQTFYKK